ncbi:MAG: bifunctional serine/threonine-protein kinase/formylglycine-generating enzyme family protein [Myxococcota bacterium]|nr:bifunctional serine/threonine-protein kinase/formylglycine-generating enzyme family protein [Myxococcota bacterium]
MKKNPPEVPVQPLIEAVQPILQHYSDLSDDVKEAIIETLVIDFEDTAQISTEVKQLLNTFKLPQKLLAEITEVVHKQHAQINNRPITERYSIQELLGRGGMGSVYRAHDKQLNRHVAIKVLNQKHAQHESLHLERFTDEALIIAQLEHPSIIPIYDVGQLPDGRLFFTMKEVHGIEMGKMIQAVHSALENGHHQTQEGWSFRGLIDVLLRVSEAVAFAHSKGILHRDLKPSNIMVGEYGEVLLLDWGIAKILHSSIPEIQDIHDSRVTHTQGMVGTPVYLAPESIKGAGQLKTTADIYSLGMILYEILMGKHPFVGQSPQQIIVNAIKGNYPKLRTHSDTDPLLFEGTKPEVHRIAPGKVMSLELIKLCEAATEVNPELRLSTADRFVSRLKGWLQGLKKQSNAQQLIDRAETYTSRIRQMKIKQEAQLRAFDHTEVIPLQECKAITQNEQSLKSQQMEQEQLLYAALYQDPHNELAHSALAHIYAEKITDALYGNNSSIISQVERRAREHLASLPRSNPTRAHYHNMLKGLCKIDITVPNQVQSYSLFEYINGSSPKLLLTKEPLNAGTLSKELKPGSYLLILHAEGFVDIRIPVWLSAGDIYQHLNQEQTAQLPLRLLQNNEIHGNECYIPAGAFWAKRNRIEQVVKCWKKIWMPDLLMKANPVTHQEYLEFINASQVAGRSVDTLLPRQIGPSGLSESLYKVKKNGLYFLSEHLFNTQPATGMSWAAANQFSQWYAEKKGQPWRIPSEHEWMKAARGGDKRIFPWGDHPEQHRCSNRSATSTPKAPGCIMQQNEDISPYLIRGVAGNVIDWTSSHWIDHKGVESQDVIVKGGSWDCPYWLAQIDQVRVFPTTHYDSTIGFRLCRSL